MAMISILAPALVLIMAVFRASDAATTTLASLQVRL